MSGITDYPMEDPAEQKPLPTPAKAKKRLFSDSIIDGITHQNTEAKLAITIR